MMNPNYESDLINSARETKRFLQKVEADIGLKKALYAKPHFLKNTFKPETLKKYRQAGGIPPSNRQVYLNEEMIVYDYNYNLLKL